MKKISSVYVEGIELAFNYSLSDNFDLIEVDLLNNQFKNLDERLNYTYDHESKKYNLVLSSLGYPTQINNSIIKEIIIDSIFYKIREIEASQNNPRFCV